ncbi:hypothetical protein CSV69_10225 [Sporosarcina sp. P26b]|uniref:hypothetical protein n=1 Tax=Sporosarcina sp. P26b TaxID=2048253 RepID=UPI000C16B0F9|nr:hypothetical protein [Sporosarcina sp. P26b]PIC95707.1 hypothetical protein CSV69_10225 [Sporosarcina sp. P26b]
MDELTREVEWFIDTLQQKCEVEVTVDLIATEAVELGLDEVEDFYVPDGLLDNQPTSLLYEIMVTNDEEENEWVGGIAFYPNSPEWWLQVITKNGHLVYRNVLPLPQ